MSAGHAVILAAGLGQRLMPITQDRPKVLVEFKGEPILVRMLRQLVALGVGDATVVVGDRSAQVREVVERRQLPLEVEWRFNPEYASANNSWSLALAAGTLKRGCLLIEGDVIASQEVLTALVGAAPPTCWLVRRFLPDMEGAFLRADETGRLRSVSIIRGDGVPIGEGLKSMGLLKLSPSYGSRLAEWLLDEVSSGRRDRYYDLVIADHVMEDAPVLVRAEHGFWMEVDTPDDLSLAASRLGNAE